MVQRLTCAQEEAALPPRGVAASIRLSEVSVGSAKMVAEDASLVRIMLFLLIFVNMSFEL